MQQLKEKKTAPAATPPEVASVSPFFWVGILLMVAIAAADLLLESRPMHFIHVSHRTDLTAAKLRVAFLLLLSAGLGLWVDRGALKYPFRIGCVLAVLAILMAVVHVATVDTRTIKGVRLIEGRPQVVVNPYIENWQRKLYMDILNAWPEPARESVPHIYRPLPYGFTRVLELASSDWGFACLVYRAFFDFWLLWASYRFVLFFSTALRAWLALGILLALYPFSICYYWGQLTDPMSHAFFVLGLLFIVQDNWLGLLVAVFAGVLAKETAMVLVIAYLAVHWRKGLIAWVRTGLVGLGAVAAFLAARCGRFQWSFEPHDHHEPRDRDSRGPHRCAPAPGICARRAVYRPLHPGDRVALASDRQPTEGPVSHSDAAGISEQPLLQLAV